jgi:hypothetical protein
MNMGAANPAPWRRSTDAWSRVLPPKNLWNCFGKLARDTGQSRDPVPPHMITGCMMSLPPAYSLPFCIAERHF